MGLKGVYFIAILLSFLVLQGCTSQCPADLKICPDGTTVGRTGPNCVFDECPKYQGCSEEAKICPDGSSVARIPPNCEFPECPEVNSDCNYDDEKQYVSKNIETCSILRYICEVGSYAFSNECGCGCEPENVKECTPEGKLCLDGTTVFRLGPDCKFEKCPEYNGTEEIVEPVIEVEVNQTNVTVNETEQNETIVENITTSTEELLEESEALKEKEETESQEKTKITGEESENTKGTSCGKLTYARKISCLKIYDPVCGYYEECENNCSQTFDNSCFACNEGVSYWISGEC